jgi:PHD/YefM family antitoxin component YafN of YafNO toxin-antitoxin module
MLKPLELPKVEFITASDGKPKAVVLSLADWKRISETLKIISNKGLIKSIRRAKQQLRKGAKLLSFDEVFKNL